MRVLGIIFAVLLTAAIFVWLYIKLIVSKIAFKLSLNRIEIGQINLSTLQSGTSFINLKVNLEIINNSDLAIKFSDLRMQIFNNTVLVASTPTDYRRSEVRVPKKSKVYTVEPVELYINPETLAMLVVLKSGQPVRLDYTVSVKIFGVPYNYSSFFEYTFSMFQQ